VKSIQQKLKIQPLKPARWSDFEELFGKKGACAGCWCMWWRLPAAQWRAQKGNGNRKAMRSLVQAKKIPGLLAYVDGKAIGWCAVGPRVDFVRFSKSRVLKPVDENPVWSVTCFFVAREYRRQGVTIALLKAAVEFARKRGAEILEGYPTDPKHDQPDVFVFTGLASAYQKAGFKEVARRSLARPIFRRHLATATKK
jgi:GNAT superfamily N-acetyltransferase